MTWLRNIGWVALTLAILAAGAVPDLVTLPKPEGALVLERATYLPDTGTSSEVSLPHAIFPQLSQHPDSVRYFIDFNLKAVPDKPLFIFIPSINRRISLAFNGETLFGFESSSFWTGPLIGASVMVRLPHSTMAVGRNLLTVAVDSGPFAVPTYLSRIYVGTEEALAWPFKVRTFFEGQLKTMALAAHVLLGVGLIFAYFFRPNDPLFAWLAVLNVVSLIVAIGLFIGWQPALYRILPYVVILTPASALLFFGVALALIHVHPPKALAYAVIATPFALLPCALIDTTLAKTISAGIGLATVIVSFVAAAGLMALGAFRQRDADARLMLGPYCLMAWFAVRDAYVTATLPEHGFDLLGAYPRPLFLAFLTAVLMRRMAVSLDQVDRANETLNIKLAEREAELAAFHRQERAKTANLVREQERQRLTHDLHDGISGHLVSIIALSERVGDKAIEQAAREALGDLRLVIYSLDLGDRELPLALANFRERLVPQLQRMGIELDWSIVNLPEVSGVTPGNALAVLRILQEAITNAIKHGPARRIVIRGAAATDGMAMITIENDGRSFVESGGGHGLANMRRRAEQLRGRLTIGSVEQGVKITLLLPSCLPDFEDEAVA